MKRVPTNDPDDDFVVEITSLDTSETSEHAHGELLQGARLAPRVRILLTVLSGMGALLLIFVVLSPVLSPLLPKKTSTPPAALHLPPTQIENVSVQNGIAYITSSDGSFRALRMKNGSLLWQRNLPDVRPFFMKNTMYVYYYDQQDYTIQALDASNGKLLWTFKAPSFTFLPLIINNGVATVLTTSPLSSMQQGYSKGQVQGQTLIGLDGRTGAELWQYGIHTSSHLNVSVQAMQDKIYISMWSDYQMRNVALFVLKSSDGLPLWHYTNPDSGQTNPSSDPQPTLTPPLTPNGTIYLTMGDGSLKALNAANGHEIWHYTPAHNTYSSSSIGKNLFYMQTLNQPLKALRADNGALQWTYKDPWGVAEVFPEANGVLYIETSDGFIVALRTSDGTRLWHVRPLAPPFTFGSIQVEGGIVYTFSVVGAAQDETIAALRASDGSILWRRYMGASTNNMFSQIINGQLFTDSGSTVTVLRASDGTVLWHANYTQTASQYNPGFLAPGNNIMILRLSDSVLEAHQAETGAVLWRYPRASS